MKDGAGISRAGSMVAMALAAAAGAGVVYFGPGLLWPKPPAPKSAVQDKFPDELPREARPRTVALAEIVGERAEPAPPAAPGDAVANTTETPAPPPRVPDAEQAVIAAAPAAAPPPEQRAKAPADKRGLVILQIGDSHTSADFLTGELRRRLQARYGRGGPGYITAGHPHIGVRSSSLKITASSGWSYKSLQKPDAETAEFWLSGYNAVASGRGETMSFASDEPQSFDMIEIEVVRQPGGGSIDIKLDGVVEMSYELKSSKIEPVVIRLMPTRDATEKMHEISITTTGSGQVTLASVAIYNRQSGLTYNSVGYVGAQATLLNKLNGTLFANDLKRINPAIVVLAFGTNEASNEGLDLAQYGKSYERVIEKIKTTLPNATMVVILPPDFSEPAAACRKKDRDRGNCAAAPDCGWRTPARLNQVREVQREIAQRLRLVAWNWAAIMPSECGAHRWFTASPPLMAKDHVHFTTEGYKKSAEQFLDTLIPVIEKVRVGENVIPNN